jgi:hypothetical protein
LPELELAVLPTRALPEAPEELAVPAQPCLVPPKALATDPVWELAVAGVAAAADAGGTRRQKRC